tara:strand:+ start:2186 stop:2482 length:297 start_codon:yes stop_codon:yes gene_type:complete
MILELKSFEMIEKTDLPGGYQCVLDFDNETQLSIISGIGASGGDQGLYEIAVFKNGDFAGLPGVVDVEAQVRGHLTEDEIDVIIKKMYLLTGKVPSQV